MVNYLKFTLSCSLAVLTAITAQIKFYLIPIPYTFQNFAVILSGLILGKYGFFPQLIYLGMIALGFPASARGGGIGVLFGYTSGYLWMFPITAFIMGIVRERVWRSGSRRECAILWIFSIFAIIPMYLLGFYVFWMWVSGDKAFIDFWMAFISTLAIFLPQDVLMDHAFAILTFRQIYRFLKVRGYEI